MEKIIRVHPELEDELKKIKTRMSDRFRKTYKIEVNLPSNAASKIAAMKLRGKRTADFRIERHGLNRGRIRIL